LVSFHLFDNHPDAPPHDILVCHQNLRRKSAGSMPKPTNLITDVPGLRVGHAHDNQVCSGVTVVLPDQPAVAAVDIRGGGPGTRESDCIALESTVSEVHGLVLSGGSAFGLSAATGVQSWLVEHNRGFDIGGIAIPIVPQAILFDMLNGGDKNWGTSPPYEHLGRKACETAAVDCALGSVGAGFGATTADLRGGLGSASARFENDIWIGALVAVNAVGSVTVGNTGKFWAAPFEVDGEFGGFGAPTTWPKPGDAMHLKGGAAENTTLGIVATNAHLTKTEAHRLAVMAQTGIARAIYPVHTPLDGDAVFALATGQSDAALAEDWTPNRLAMLGAMGADVMARAVARGVYYAAPTPEGWTGPPAWETKFGRAKTA